MNGAFPVTIFGNFNKHLIGNNTKSKFYHRLIVTVTIFRVSIYLYNKFFLNVTHQNVSAFTATWYKIAL